MHAGNVCILHHSPFLTHVAVLCRPQASMVHRQSVGHAHKGFSCHVHRVGQEIWQDLQGIFALRAVKCTMVWQHCSSLRGMWCLLQFFSGAQPVVVINDAELARCEGKVPYLGADSWHWSNRSVKGIIL